MYTSSGQRGSSFTEACPQASECLVATQHDDVDAARAASTARADRFTDQKLLGISPELLGISPELLVALETSWARSSSSLAAVRPKVHQAAGGGYGCTRGQ